jgi:hypothetical protein
MYLLCFKSRTHHAIEAIGRFVVCNYGCPPIASGRYLLEPEPFGNDEAFGDIEDALHGER